MKILFLCLLAMAVWHFIYEGIIAPSIRMQLRNRLFALRDELRQIDPRCLSEDDRAAFWFVHDGINNFLNRLPNLTIHVAKRLEQEYRHDTRIVATLESHLKKVIESENSVIRDVFARTNKVIGNTMLTNAGGSFIYIVPMALIAIFAGSIKSFVSRLILTPSKDVDRLIPASRRAAETV